MVHSLWSIVIRMITIHHYLIVAAILFTLGLLGIVMRRNLLIIFMCIEVMLNSVNLTFIALARYVGNMDGHVVAFFVMAVAAAEAAIGLGILVMLYRRRGTIMSSDYRLMGG
jgi:NADH-quinone oxidoreductase subunit K